MHHHPPPPQARRRRLPPIHPPPPHPPPPHQNLLHPQPIQIPSKRTPLRRLLPPVRHPYPPLSRRFTPCRRPPRRRASTPPSPTSIRPSQGHRLRRAAHTTSPRGSTRIRAHSRGPTDVSEYERMKRMSSVYFNMEQWEQEVAQRKDQEDEDAANGKKRKRPTKKDLVCYFFLPGLCRLCSRNTHRMYSTGALQRAEEAQKDCKDGLVAHVDHGASRIFILVAVHEGHSVIPVLWQLLSKIPC